MITPSLLTQPGDRQRSSLETRLIDSFVFEHPEVVLAELRAARAAAGVTVRTNDAVTEVKCARPAANVAHSIFVRTRLLVGFNDILPRLFHISNVASRRTDSIHAPH